MTFDEVINEIQQEFPGSTPGRTAQAGSYFDQAQRMTFRRTRAGQYEARGPRGGVMYIGICENPRHRAHGMISCGPKG